VGHLQANGYDVEVREVGNAELVQIKSEHGVPQELTHTGIVDGYVIEGHVPADVVDRLLRERPDVIGLSVPGMPVGSPGMEGPRGHRLQYVPRLRQSSGAIRESRRAQPRAAADRTDAADSCRYDTSDMIRVRSATG
jgi:hypothetical protein